MEDEKVRGRRKEKRRRTRRECLLEKIKKEKKKISRYVDEATIMPDSVPVPCPRVFNSVKASHSGQSEFSPFGIYPQPHKPRANSIQSQTTQDTPSGLLMVKVEARDSRVEQPEEFFRCRFLFRVIILTENSTIFLDGWSIILCTEYGVHVL